MRRLRSFSSQTRLMLFFALLILAAAWFAGSAVLDAMRYLEKLNTLQMLTQRQQRRAIALSDFITEELLIKNVLLDPDEINTHMGGAARFRENFIDFLKYEQISAQESEAADIQEVVRLRQVYDEATAKLFQAVQNNASPQEISQIHLEEVEPAGIDMETQISLLAGEDQQLIEDQNVALQESVKATAQSGGAAFVLLGVMLVLGVAIANNIFEPLLSLNNALVQFENGSFRSEMLYPHTERGDELGQITRSFDVMASSIQESNRLKEQFLQAASRFIPMQYLEFLEKEDITRVDLGDHVAAEMAVMFSDLRGFTTLSEKMSAQENFDFINEYLRLVSPVIQQHEGFIVKFLGDGMMAIFPYGVEDAVQAGIEKQAKVEEFNAELARRGYPPLSVGIGIHTGAMMVGMIGEEARIQGDAFSDNVNLTSRIEGLNKFYGTSMIISEDTRQQLKNPGAYRMRFLGRVIVKGRQTPLGLYEVYQGLSPEVMQKREATRSDFERGIALYAQGQFQAALAAFQAVLAVDPNDKTAQYYANHSRQWSEQSAPPGWDGVIIMDQK